MADPVAAARGLCALRAAIGVALVLAPRSTMRVWTGLEPDHGHRLAGRAVGARDLVLGLGGLGALGGGRTAEWLRAGAIADASDALGTLGAFGELPRTRRWLLMASALGGAAAGAALANRID